MRNLPSKKYPRVFSGRLIKRRILMIALGYFLFMTVILGRTFGLHLTDNSKLSKLAQNQYQKKITLAPKRGSVLDIHGESLAVDMKVDSLYAKPHLIQDSEVAGVAKKLSSILGMDAEKIRVLLSKEKKFVWIKRRLSSEESQKIQTLHLDELGLVPEYRRFYPNKKLAATILGAVGYDSVALGGLELFYDSVLKSASEPVLMSQDAHGKTYSPYEFFEVEEPSSLQLTLDKTIQFITEKTLQETVSRTQAKSGIAVVMNSHTGEILAMASYPDFDPNDYSNSDLQHWKNRVITDSFEPGSIFKAVTAAAALESGKVTVDQKFNCENGAYQVGKFTIHDHGSYGAMALPEIIRVSSNICSFKIAQFLGRDLFARTVSNFGFGKKTGIDLPGEVSGILAPASKWSAIQQGTISFGQGISVTPIQIANAYSAIANGGKLMRPFVVKKVLGPKGDVIEEKNPQMIQQVMNEANARQLTEILKLVVESGGTGTAAQVEEYGVAGKTGTAQKVTEGKGRSGYADGKFIASFVGFAPADNPKITVLVSIDEPKGNHFGGVVAAPVFRDIVRQTLPYLRVPPRGSHGTVVMTKSESQKYENSTDPVEADVPIEDSEVSQKAEKSSEKSKKPGGLTEVETGSYRLPDYKGKTLREIMKTWDDSELHLEIEGSGVCGSQSPAPGQVVKKGSSVKIFFK